MPRHVTEKTGGPPDTLSSPDRGWITIIICCEGMSNSLTK